MRRGAALAASGLLALALGAASCKPSSLTPFTDWKEPETASGVNGFWQGTTSTAGGPDGTIDFTVASDRVNDVRLLHSPGNCGRIFESGETSEDVDNNTFHLDFTLETQGRLVIDGTFTSETTVTGTYFYEGIRISGGCSSSSTGTFTATKNP